MPIEFQSLLRVTVPEAVRDVAAHTIAVQAYDVLAVTVAAGATVTVEVQPGGAGQVALLLATASVYGPDLTYTVGGGVSDVLLDAPLLLQGAGAVGLLGAAPATMDFTNSGSEDVAVRLVVGRNATA